jgi:hypothetical protein
MRKYCTEIFKVLLLNLQQIKKEQLAKEEAV